jgi:hypothetical protein
MLSRIARHRSFTSFAFAFGMAVLLSLALYGQPELAKSSVYAISVTVGLQIGRRLYEARSGAHR